MTQGAELSIAQDGRKGPPGTSDSSAAQRPQPIAASQVSMLTTSCLGVGSNLTLDVEGFADLRAELDEMHPRRQGHSWIYKRSVLWSR